MKRISALLLVMAASAAGSNWPQFRGPSASGLGAGATPTAWDGSAGTNVLWKTPIPGLGHSSPVIWGHRIFLTSAVPERGAAELKLGLYGSVKPVEGEGVQAFKLYCLDRRSGRILWERTAASGVPKIKRHPKGTHANPTPATDGRHVIAMFGSEGLYAFDFEGKQLWRKDLGVLDSGFFTAPGAQWGFASSPVIHSGAVLIQADVQKDSFLAAFDVRTGRELWRTPRHDVPTWSTPTVVPRGAGAQVVLNGWKQIAGYDFKTGQELWSMAGGGDIPVPTPVFDGGFIIITNAHGPGRPIYAIRPDAAGDAKKALAWSAERSGNYMQTPLLYDGLGYFCNDNGVLNVFDLKNGERLYQQRLGTGGAGFSSSPVAAGGRLYFTSEEGDTFVLSPGRSFQQVARNQLGEQVMATPAISQGILYIRARTHLFAIGGPAK